MHQNRSESDANDTSSSHILSAAPTVHTPHLIRGCWKALHALNPCSYCASTGSPSTQRAQDKLATDAEHLSAPSLSLSAVPVVCAAHLRKGCWKARLQGITVVLLCPKLRKASPAEDEHPSRASASSSIPRAHKERVAFFVKHRKVGRGLLAAQRGHQDGFVLHVVLLLLESKAGHLRL